MKTNDNLIQLNPFQSQNYIDKATIKAVNNTHDAQQYLVNSGHGLHHAKIAVSCLITPDVGDSVLVCMLNDECFITSVLEKQRTAHSINIQGDLNLHASGKTTISSDEGISLYANKIQQVSQEQQFTTKTLNTCAQQVSITTKNIDLSAEQTNTVVERCYHKAQLVVRWVETIETLNIGNWIHNIRHTLNSRANNQIITARSDVKVDAERIHMG